jgi:hypothetical protein
VKDCVLHFAALQLSVLRVAMWPSEIRLVVSLDKFSAINVDLVGSARHDIPPIACELHPCLDQLHILLDRLIGPLGYGIV